MYKGDFAVARPNKMWWWEQKGEYCVTIRGIRHRLGAERDAAERKFHEILAAEPEEVPVDPQSVLAVMDVFLDKAGFKSAETQKWYQKHCQSFVDFMKGEGLRGLHMKDFAPLHVNRWLKSHGTWSDGTKNGACRAVQRAFRWANQMGYIKTNPIAFVPDKPPPGKRENIIKPEEYVMILSLVRDDDFKDLLTVSWECGSRPQESLRAEKRHFNEKCRRWEFPVNEAKGKRKVRFVYLTDNALKITKRRMLTYPEGPIFRNTDGNPWTTFAVSCRFTRLEKHIGRKIALYDFRHSFTERLRQAGIDSVNIAVLLGHADLSMVGRVYAHPHVNPEHLLNLLNKGTD
jgi:integrase